MPPTAPRFGGAFVIPGLSTAASTGWHFPVMTAMLTEGDLDRGCAPDPRDEMPWLCGAHDPKTGAVCDLRPLPRHGEHAGWQAVVGQGRDRKRVKFTVTQGRVAHRGERPS